MITGCRVRSETPRSNLAVFFKKDKYCLYIGSLKPKSFLAFSICYLVGWSPTHKNTGSPGSQRTIKNVILQTINIIKPIKAILLKIYLYINFYLVHI